MALRSSTTRYGSVAIAIHWLSAVAIVFMLGSGLAMGSMADPTPLLRVHVVTGVVVGLVILISLFLGLVDYVLTHLVRFLIS